MGEAPLMGSQRVVPARGANSRVAKPATNLFLLAQFGDAGSVTQERELVNGEVLSAAALKR